VLEARTTRTAVASWVDGESGNRSPRASELDASRAWVLELAPFAAALNDGLITPEHVDVLGVALRRIGARDQAELLALQTEILDAGRPHGV
jgi:hypothetical protein